MIYLELVAKVGQSIIGGIIAVGVVAWLVSLGLAVFLLPFMMFSWLSN